MSRRHDVTDRRATLYFDVLNHHWLGYPSVSLLLPGTELVFSWEGREHVYSQEGIQHCCIVLGLGAYGIFDSYLSRTERGLQHFFDYPAPSNNRRDGWGKLDGRPMEGILGQELSILD